VVAVAPKVPGAPVLGSALELRRDLLGASERAARRYGDVVRFVAGPPGLRIELYLLAHPDGARQVLASGMANYRKDNAFYAEVRSAFGDGLLTSQDEEWQRQKRFLQPLFTPRRVAGYAAAMAGIAQDFADEFRARPAGVVDLHAEMTRLTLEMVGRVLFGNDAGQALPIVRETMEPLGAAVRRRGIAPIVPPLTWPTPVNRRFIASRRAIRAAGDEIIARRRAHPKTGAEDLLGLLLAARDGGEALSDDEVRDQVMIFMLAGHETTATALTFALHLLGRYPGVQRKVRAEVDEIVGDRTPTAADALALTYTTMVLKETMRLYPSAPFLGRRAVADDEIRGYRIPAGADVMLSPWVIHRHPEFWPEPARFVPERFTAEAEKSRHRYAWCPFGGGPHACIGQHFSMLESVLTLAALVRAVEFTAPPDDPPYEHHITLRPTRGVPSRVAPR
jgi:cytochrome P450